MFQFEVSVWSWSLTLKFAVEIWNSSSIIDIEVLAYSLKLKLEFAVGSLMLYSNQLNVTFYFQRLDLNLCGSSLLGSPLLIRRVDLRELVSKRTDTQDLRMILILQVKSVSGNSQ